MLTDVGLVAHRVVACVVCVTAIAISKTQGMHIVANVRCWQRRVWRRCNARYEVWINADTNVRCSGGSVIDHWLA